MWILITKIIGDLPFFLASEIVKFAENLSGFARELKKLALGKSLIEAQVFIRFFGCHAAARGAH